MTSISKIVEKYSELILEAERYIWAHPETGYKEFKTDAYMKEKFESLGYELTLADGITGFYTVVDTGRPGPEVLILGELDSIICQGHKAANPETGAVHSCGHHAQCAALLGIAAALREPEMLDMLSGRIRLCAVPAEELLEIDYRDSLREKGLIKYYGGKCEFLHRGYFDGVDIAFMVHTTIGDSFTCNKAAVGCIAKKITYKGVSAHAGGSPHRGINALYAANCGLNAINAIRETFQEDDYLRVHPIITHGGDIVNAIPEKVQLESYVRGVSFEAMEKTNVKVNRALSGAALSIGANVEINDLPGYSPLINAPGMIEVAREALQKVYPDEEFKYSGKVGTGSTDMGDLSAIMPAIHPYAPGATGRSHGDDYCITDPKRACIMSAVWQLSMLEVLLGGNCERAYKVIEEFRPLFASKEEFLRYKDTLNASGDRIIYRDGIAEVRL